MPGGGKRSAADLIVIGPAVWAATSVKRKLMWEKTKEIMRPKDARSK